MISILIEVADVLFISRRSNRICRYIGSWRDVDVNGRRSKVFGRCIGSCWLFIGKRSNLIGSCIGRWEDVDVIGRRSM